MATKMSFNYFQSQSGKYGTTLPQNSASNAEVSQDLHLKMSKKIAQLTKVIYALNTKNDEHDAVIQSLKENHEEELHQLLAETKKKIAVYQSRVSSEVESKRRIENLEASVSKYQQHQQKSLADFDSFKRHAEERLCELKKEHATKIVEISHAVLVAKQEFAENVEKFEAFRRQFESDKKRELEELIKKHETELESVRNFQGSQNEEMTREVSRLNEKHQGEISALNQKYEELQNEKSKSEEDYELKLQKAQAFYEKELEVLKNEQSASQDSIINNLKEQQEKLRKDFALQEAELKKQSDSLINQLADSEETIEKHQSRINQLESLLQNSDSTSSTLHNQIKDLEDKLSASMKEISDHKTELSTLNHKTTDLSSQLNQKSVLLKGAEETKLKQGERIQDLESKLSKLQTTIKELESEKMKLFSNQQNLSEQQITQLKHLQQSLEDLTIEKQTMEQRYEREVHGLKDRHSNHEQELTVEHESILEDLRTRLEGELGREKQDSAELLKQTEQYWKDRFDAETTKLKDERETILSEFEKVKSELFTKLKTAEAEVQRLENSVEDSQQGLGSAASHINNLKEAANRLKTELDNTRVDLKFSKTTSANLQAEIDKLKLQHESQLTETDLASKMKLEALKTGLDATWAETLKNETNKLRKQIADQSESERNSAVLQLTLRHEKEMKELTAEWEGKVNGLTIQITDLQRSANKNSTKSSEELERVRLQMSELEKKLKKEMLQAGEEYARKISVMEAAQENQLKALIERKDLELKENEKKNKNKHVEDLQIQVTAHRAAVQNIQEQADQLRHDRETTLIKQHQQELDKLRLELSEKLEKDFEDVKRKHDAEIRAARIELERAIEISKQKDRDNHSRIEELQMEITKRERTIINLEEETRNLKRAIEELKRDIKERDKQIKQVQNEAKRQIKQLEDEFRVEYKRNVDNLQSDHLQQINELVADFNTAQEILKDKISSLQIQLEEAEERYRNRDSRPEDLELIMQLRDAIQERELRVKELIDEKRFFQLELVNRETNFNKIFNTTPNIGVMNPLNPVKPKNKKNDKPFKHSSAPALSQRLDPLPNSPLHEEKINPSRPLPPFNKKFIK